MFESVLIANRGEIARRVIRTARRMGLRTIAVYSDADRDAPHAREADVAVRIGAAPARESYLVGERIIAAARATAAACIHPGYGFLSENADFAEACAAAGLAFVGPPPSAIRAMGLKDEAKILMERAGVPVVPGYHGAEQGAEFLRARAREIGWPVLIKAVAGGGGKGMRRVDADADFLDALEGARREALAFFGEDRVLVEKYVDAPRHIEMQVFGDAHGNVVHLFERDCSLQRRHQKVIEEAPAPGVSDAMRAAMGRAAVEAARAVGYIGAGTVEFIAEGGADLTGNFWFMEMNTRLQVEHPVTETITGLDLVEWQLRVAAGERLPQSQDEIKATGHAVEARVYAEDPMHGFLPSTGELRMLRFPEAPGLRVDSGVEEGGEVGPHYDPMIAKVIARGDTREDALSRLAGGLRATRIIGPRCNLGFLVALCEARDFREGRFDTGFIARHIAELLGPEGRDDRAIALGAAALVEASLPRVGDDPWDARDAFQFVGARRVEEMFLADGEPATVAIEWRDGRAAAFVGDARSFAVREGDGWRCDDALAIAAGDSMLVLHEGRQTNVRRRGLERRAEDETNGGGLVRSPMHGKLVALDVARGDEVRKGQKLAVVEAMKMEHALVAPFDGVVADVSVARGAQVAQGAAVVTIEPKRE